MTLFPEALDDYISADNPVRFLEAFVGTLDIKALGFKNATLKETGRPPYHPGDLLRLYIYGYLNRFRSSRKSRPCAAIRSGNSVGKVNSSLLVMVCSLSWCGNHKDTPDLLFTDLNLQKYIYTNLGSN